METPTKAALKSNDAALARPASPVQDPLNPDLEADPLRGDPYVDLFGEDSDGDDIPCGQPQNMESLLQLAEELGSQGHTLEEDLLAPPITAPAPQPQPAPGQPPVFDMAALVAALKKATPPPPPRQPEMTQSRKNRSIASSLRTSAQSVAAPALWSRDWVARKACAVDDRRVVKDAGSFGDSTLTRFFPLVEEDETLLKILEIDAEVIEYLRSTYKLDWDPAKPFGAKPNTATKEAE